jgi:chromate transporter
MPPKLGLFTSFLELGMTAFGGPAMVAYIRQMAVKKKLASRRLVR